MEGTRLKPSQKTIKKLYAKSGNKCAFPECEESLFSNGNSENISQVCHIEAAREGGQRYNPNSNDEYRRSYENLILLCPNHHKVTDDIENFSIEKLKRIKQEHERSMEHAVFKNNPSLISKAIRVLAEIDWDDLDDNDGYFASFSIDNKIDHNQIIRWKPRINEYKTYQAKIESTYSVLEKSGESFRKKKLLHIIKNTYLKNKGFYIKKYSNLPETEVVEKHSDDILDAIEESLIEKSNNNQDDIYIAIPIIMVDAFMRCKILEKPE